MFHNVNLFDNTWNICLLTKVTDSFFIRGIFVQGLLKRCRPCAWEKHKMLSDKILQIKTVQGLRHFCRPCTLKPLILLLLFHAAATAELIHEIDGIGLFATHFSFCPVDFTLVPGIVADAH